MQKDQEMEKKQKNVRARFAVAAFNGVALAVCLAAVVVNACARDYDYAIMNVMLGAVNASLGVANYSYAKRDFRRICEIQQQMKKHQNGK